MGAVSQYILGWNTAAAVCLIVGLLLMVYEMFTPGLGLAGGLGGVALIAAIVLRADSIGTALTTLALIIILLGVAAFFIFRSFAKGRLSNSPIVLKESVDAKSTSLSDEAMQALIGREGVCLNTLRPSGNADFDGDKLDVVSSGEFIQKGTRVRIVRIEGLRILVQRV